MLASLCDYCEYERGCSLAASEKGGVVECLEYSPGGKGGADDRSAKARAVTAVLGRLWRDCVAGVACACPSGHGKALYCEE